MKDKQELGLANAILRAQQEAASSGVLVIGKQGSVVSYNRRFLELWNIPIELAERGSDANLLDYVRNELKDWSGFIELIEYLYAHPEETRWAELVELKSGRVLSRNTKPVRLESGEIIGRVWDFTDITDLVQARQDLQLKEHTLDNAADAVYWLNQAGRYLYANATGCSALGYTVDELLALSVFDVAPEVTPEVWQELWHSISPRESRTTQTEHRTKDGRQFPVEVTCILVSFGTREFLCASARDISERKQAEEQRLSLERQFLEAQRLESIGLLAGGIAHDFNNLLTPILGYAGLISRVANEDSPVARNANKILNAANSAEGLIRQLLAYVGKSHVQRSRIRLQDLVREMTELLEVSIPKQITIELALDAEDLQISADVTQMRQIILNLVTNACDAIGQEPGLVRLTMGQLEVDEGYAGSIAQPHALKPGPHVWLKISDNGCGMDQETCERIFDPFFTTKQTGHGLGLAAVSGIVRVHDGMIQVQSEAGKGTTFTLLLPRWHRPGERVLDVAERPPAELAQGNVLIIDDQLEVRETAADLLTHLGLGVLQAGSGTEALELIGSGSGPLSCVLLDVSISGLGSEDTLRRIHQDWPDLPVVLMSGHGQDPWVSRLVDGDSVAFLAKPFTLTQLAELIAGLLK